VGCAGEKGDLHLPNANDGGDDADLLALGLEPAALLDVWLEIGDMPAGLEARPGRTGIPAARSGGRQRLAFAVGCTGDRVLEVLADEGAAAR